MESTVNRIRYPSLSSPTRNSVEMLPPVHSQNSIIFFSFLFTTVHLQFLFQQPHKDIYTQCSSQLLIVCSSAGLINSSLAKLRRLPGRNSLKVASPPHTVPAFTKSAARSVTIDFGCFREDDCPYQPKQHPKRMTNNKNSNNCNFPHKSDNYNVHIWRLWLTRSFPYTVKRQVL